MIWGRFAAVGRSQRGLSLVELMVALVIGLVLTAGIIQVFLANQTAYREGQRIAQLQEELGFAVDFMVRDIRGASRIEHPDGDARQLRVIRDREQSLCGVHPPDTAVVYHVDAGVLRCGPAGDSSDQALLESLKPGSHLTAELKSNAGGDVIGVKLSLVLARQGEAGDAHAHQVTFHVASRGPILMNLAE